MVGSFKQSLLVLSSIAVAFVGCTYNEDDLRPGNPNPRDAGALDSAGAPDLLSLVDLPGAVDLPGGEDLPPVSIELDADTATDDAEIADVPELPEVGEDTNAPGLDAAFADADVDASLPERDSSADLSTDRATDERSDRDTSDDAVDSPPTGSDARDAGLGDSAADLQQRESGGSDSKGIFG
jgi:hypothetical protein